MAAEKHGVALADGFFDVRGKSVVAFAERSLLSPHQTRCRERFIRQLEQQINQEWACTLFPYGSTRTGLALKSSDLDLCCVFHEPPTLCDAMDQLKRAVEIAWVQELFGYLRHLGMRPLECVRARVSIVRKTGAPRGGAHNFDLSLRYNGVRNSDLLAMYFAKPHVRALGVAVGFWSKQAKVNGAQEGHLTSYAWSLLLLHFLIRGRHVDFIDPAVIPNCIPGITDQPRPPPPPLVPVNKYVPFIPPQLLPRGPRQGDTSGDGSETWDPVPEPGPDHEPVPCPGPTGCPGIDADVPLAPHTGHHSQPESEVGPKGGAHHCIAPAPVSEANPSTVGRLFADFLRFYAFEFKYDQEVATIRSPGASTANRGGAHLHLEDPYELDRNLGSKLNEQNFRRMRQALEQGYRRFMDSQDFYAAFGKASAVEETELS